VTRLAASSKIRSKGFIMFRNGGGLAASRRFSHFIHHSPNTNSTAKPVMRLDYWEYWQTWSKTKTHQDFSAVNLTLFNSQIGIWDVKQIYSFGLKSRDGRCGPKWAAKTLSLARCSNTTAPGVRVPKWFCCLPPRLPLSTRSYKAWPKLHEALWNGLKPDNVRIYRRAVPRPELFVAACELPQDLQDEIIAALCQLNRKTIWRWCLSLAVALFRQRRRIARSLLSRAKNDTY